VGLESARYVEERYHIPLLHYPVLPIGAFETSKFLRAVGAFTGVADRLQDQVIDAHEAEYYYYIERYADIFLELRIMSKRFVAVSDAQYTLAVTKFLVNDLGMFPTTQYITDNTPEKYRDLVSAEFGRLNYGITAPVEYVTELRAVHDRIKQADFAGLPLILGTSWEHNLAKELYGHFINISYPVVDRLIINGHVAGYSGGLKFLEDIYTTALGALVL
jgi:nitrogenase molybdenum-iron protein beta chain